LEGRDNEKLKRFIVYFSSIGKLYICPKLVTIQWNAPLRVLPGMESELPSGTYNSQQIFGQFTYDTSSGWLSANNAKPRTLCNYNIYSWSLQLGPNIFYRNYNDSRGYFEHAGCGVENNYLRDGQIIDSFRLYHSWSAYSPPVNPYVFSLELKDYDASTFSAAEPLPQTLYFPDFEVVRLKIRHIKLLQNGTYNYIDIAEMNGLDEIDFTLFQSQR